MLPNSIRVECSSAFSAGNQILIGWRRNFEFGVLINVLIIIIDFQWGIGVAILSFFLLDIMLSNHGRLSACFLMGNQ